MKVQKFEQKEIVKTEICLFMKLIFLTTKFFFIIKALPPKGLPLTGEIIIFLIYEILNVLKIKNLKIYDFRDLIARFHTKR